MWTQVLCSPINQVLFQFYFGYSLNLNLIFFNGLKTDPVIKINQLENTLQFMVAIVTATHDMQE